MTTQTSFGIQVIAIAAAASVLLAGAAPSQPWPVSTVVDPVAEPAAPGQPEPTPSPDPSPDAEPAPAAPQDAPAETDDAAPLVRVATLVYANQKGAVCFSDDFLNQISQKTSIAAEPGLSQVPADSTELFDYPFTVMTGENAFRLTDAQRTNLREYLTGGGFLVASAGCSSHDWAQAFRREVKDIFPEHELKTLELSHPVFHTVFAIEALKTKKRHGTARLEGLEIDGRVVLVFSSDGLNDTAHAGKNCCCCGGDEITNARDVNVNLLAYALTH